MPKVICQKWEERECGWGSRPDGYSLHLTDADRMKFIEAYWATMPEEAPHEYSRPCGTPYELEVEEDVFAQLLGSSTCGRSFTGQPPGNQGPDGWRTVPVKGTSCAT